MKKYYINSAGNIDDNGLSIPCDPANSDYARILREVAAGTAEIISP